MVNFIFSPIRYNYSSRKGGRVKYLVIHDTGNRSRGANAMAHRNYFGGGNRNASAHYFVDPTQIVQIIGDSYSSWHCGDNQGRGRALNGVTNRESIGIELCINADGDYEAAYGNLVELVKNLMARFDVPASRVCRHYDVSRKSCPNSFRSSGWARWERFKRDITEPIKIKLDLSKSSKGVEVDQVKALAEREAAVAQDESKKYEAAPERDPWLKELGERFEATEPSEWAKETWAKAVDFGITDGTAPQRYATRQEVAAMLVRVMDLVKEGDHGERDRTDDGGPGYRTGL